MQHCLQMKQPEERRGLPHLAHPLTTSPALSGLVNGRSPLSLEMQCTASLLPLSALQGFLWLWGWCAGQRAAALELVVNVDPREAERNAESTTYHLSEQPDTISEKLTASFWVMSYPNRLLCPGGGQKERGPPSGFIVSSSGEAGGLSLYSVSGPLIGTLVTSLTPPGHPLMADMIHIFLSQTSRCAAST